MPIFFRRYFEDKIMKTSNVTVMAKEKSPILVVKPMAAVTQRLAAVVMP
jgi:hypothetical protein